MTLNDTTNTAPVHTCRPTDLGLKGGFISLLASFSQSINLKKAWFLISACPFCGWQPKRWPGCFVRNCNGHSSRQSSPSSHSTHTHTLSSTHTTDDGLGVLPEAAREVDLLPEDVVKELVISVSIKGRLHGATTCHLTHKQLHPCPAPHHSSPLTLPTIISYMRMPRAHQSTDMPYGR